VNSLSLFKSMLLAVIVLWTFRDLQDVSTISGTGWTPCDEIDGNPDETELPIEVQLSGRHLNK